MAQLKKLLDQLRDIGQRDALDGKTIGAFYDLPFPRHTEAMRAAYEIGYRAGHPVYVASILCKQWIKDGSPSEAGRYARIAASRANNL